MYRARFPEERSATDFAILVLCNANLDPWVSLEALNKYSGLSVRSLRAYLADPQRPLPHYRMAEPRVIIEASGKRRTVSGKILVRRSDFDRWMQAFRLHPTLTVWWMRWCGICADDWSVTASGNTTSAEEIPDARRTLLCERG